MQAIQPNFPVLKYFCYFNRQEFPLQRKTTVMRKLFLGIFIILEFQQVSGQSARFGVRAGANLFILASSNDKTQDFSSARVGYTFGGSYEMFINKQFSIQPELNYSYQEARETYYGSNLQINYTQLPILLRYYPSKAPAAFYAGPQLSFLGSANIKADDGKETGVGYKFNKTDFGFAFGVTYVPPVKGITFDLRVYRGLMKVIKSEFDGGVTTRPSLVSATFGYVFGN